MEGVAEREPAREILGQDLDGIRRQRRHGEPWQGRGGQHRDRKEWGNGREHGASIDPFRVARAPARANPEERAFPRPSGSWRPGFRP